MAVETGKITPAGKPRGGLFTPRPTHPYIHPYLAGALLGVVLFLSFLLTGNGLGASGGLNNIVGFVQDGGFVSGWCNGRLKVETMHGPRITPRTRWAMAFIGGAIMGYGARFARGCTSGHALSGGLVLSAGAWAFMFAIFGGGYALAYFLRKFWN